MILFSVSSCISVDVPQEILGGQLGTEGISHLQNLSWIWRKDESNMTAATINGGLKAHVPSLLLLQTSRVSITIFPRVLRDTFCKETHGKVKRFI